MHWNELQGDLWDNFRGSDKRNRPHEVPLTPHAQAQLPIARTHESAVFGNPAEVSMVGRLLKRKLDREIAKHGACQARELVLNGSDDEDVLIEFDLPPWGLHDFRRTFRTT